MKKTLFSLFCLFGCCALNAASDNNVPPSDKRCKSCPKPKVIETTLACSQCPTPPRIASNERICENCTCVNCACTPDNLCEENCTCSPE